MTHEDWRQFVLGMEASGFSIVQSEWHHPRFKPETEEEPAESTISLVLHVENRDQAKRFIVKGYLDVEWSGETDSNGHYLPHRIDARELTVFERKGEPIFEDILTLGSSRENGHVQPLLVYDLTGNGFSDIVMPQDNSYYENLGDHEFVRRDLCRFPEQNISAALLADLTNNGRADLLVAPLNSYPILFEADEEGKFTSPGRALFGTVGPLSLPMSITAGDVNGNGLLDLWIAQYRIPYHVGQMPTPYYNANDGYPSFLLINQGNGRFVDATVQSGLGEKRFRRTYSSSLADLNGNGHMDLLTVNDFSGLDVFFNDGEGNFTEVTDSFVDERAAFGMSHTFADFNRNGKLDFYMVGMSSTTMRRLESMGLGREEYPEHQEMRFPMAYGNRLYLGAEAGEPLTHAPFADDVSRTGWSWGSSTLDFDNSGYVDLYVVNGHISNQTAKDYCTTFWTHDIYTGSSQPDLELSSYFGEHGPATISREQMGWNPFEKNTLFQNLEGEGFIDVSFLMGAAFEYDSRAMVTDDLNGEGNVDLLVVERNRTGDQLGLLHIYKNNGLGNGHNWIGVRLSEGVGYSPVGAEVRIVSSDGVQLDRVVTGDSFRSQHSNTKHFGIGTRTEVEYIEVLWHGGETVRIENPEINRYHDVEPSATELTRN